MPHLNCLDEMVQMRGLNSWFQVHGGESGDLNDRVHGISCRYSDKQVNKTYHIFLNTQPIFIKKAHIPPNYSKQTFI